MIIEKKEYWKRYYKKNKEKIKGNSQKYYNENKREILEESKKNNKNNKEYGEKKAIRNKKYRENNKEKIKEYIKQNKNKINEKHKEYMNNRRKIDPQFNIIINLRNRLRFIIKKYKNNGKNLNNNKIKYQDIIKHLKPFPEDIENYHIDHIIPLNFFDLTNEEHLKKAYNPLNFQWLKIKDNLKKNNVLNFRKYPEQEEIYNKLNLKLLKGGEKYGNYRGTG